MKIALCFWGLTRSLKYTIISIQTKILSQLQENNVEYTIFIHTYKFDDLYNNLHANELNEQLDFDEYKLLMPDYVEIDDQNKVKETIDLEKYRTHPDPWKTDYVCVDNFLCAMYSKKRLGEMIRNSKQHFDAYLFLRPDVLYTNDFKMDYLSMLTPSYVCVPDFALWSKFNDRAFFCCHEDVFTYTDLFNHLLTYSKSNELHSETCLYNLLVFKHDLIIQYIPFHFNRVRCNGRICYDDEPKQANNSFINIVPTVKKSRNPSFKRTNNKDVTFF